MKLGPGSAWAKTLGSALAHAQHTLDTVTVWGFKKMKQAGSDPKKSTLKHTYRNLPVSFVRGTFRFLGLLGESYFKRYNDLKRKGG